MLITFFFNYSKSSIFFWFQKNSPGHCPHVLVVNFEFVAEVFFKNIFFLLYKKKKREGISMK